MPVVHPTSPRERKKTERVTTVPSGKTTANITKKSDGKSSFNRKTSGRGTQMDISRSRGPGRTTSITTKADGKSSFKRTS